MGDPEQSLLYDQHDPEAEARLETGRDSDALGPPSAGYESLRSGASAYQDLGDGKLGFEDQEEEILPEEVAGDEFLDAQDPGEAVPELERVLRTDEEEGEVPETRLSVSITPKLPRSLVARGRKGGRRLLELAKPKTTWQVLRDRTRCRCAGYAWVSPRLWTLQFCVYWPSVYWTDRFLEDTTLTVTVPAVSRRVEELARPKRFYSEFYNHCRTNPVWPVPRSTLEHHASNRLRELATPKVRNNIWSTHMSEVSRVSKAAQMAVPSSRILQLAKPRTPATLLAEWDPVPKPKPHVSDYNRLLHLAMPKSQSEKCVPDRAPRWEVLDVTKKAVASPRIISLAKPKERRDANEGYNPYYISPASLTARASPRLQELATPKTITKKV
ncbi:sperm microtubule associated protein 2 isoform X1 [Pteropus medius]|uniref:testicular haploid expressed gene protein isoform X1 n=1 Tax=Pteropus vampyrus TaxID=132908 RepID=UPI00196A7596|nr:testicular haploid expressed gene protein isoform X1 [Pteropus giganteus]